MYGASLAWEKIASALGSFVLAGAGCFVAHHLEQGKARGGAMRSILLAGGNTLAAGILLAASLTHMLPSAMKALEDSAPFPLAPTIAGSAFCFLVILGELVASCMPKREEPHTKTACVTYEASFALWPRWELMPPHGCDDAIVGSCQSTPAPHGSPALGPCGPDVDRLPIRGGCGVGSVCGHARWELLPPPGSDDIIAGSCQESPAARASPTLSCSSDPDVLPICGGYSSGSVCGRAHGSAQRARSGSGHGPAQLVQNRGHSQGGYAEQTQGLVPRPSQHSCHSHSSCCRTHRHSDEPCSTQQLKPGNLEGISNADSKIVICEHAKKVLEAMEELKVPLIGGQPSYALPSCHVRAVGGGHIVEAKSFLLFFALCFHSVMEGLGMGSAQEGGLLFTVVVAIWAHKGLAAFALGCSLSKSDLPEWKFWVFVLIFASGTPLGCAAGFMFMSGLGDGALSQNTAVGVCIALASGTFLQVSSMELLPRMLAEEDNKIVGLSGLFIGFVAMSLLAIWC